LHITHLKNNIHFMGRGDIKKKKGKIFAGSFGKKRAAKPPKKKSTPKKKA